MPVKHGPALERSRTVTVDLQCVEPDCNENMVADGLCEKHFEDHLKRLERYRKALHREGHFPLKP